MHTCAELFISKVFLWGGKWNRLCRQVGFEPYLIGKESKYSQFILDQVLINSIHVIFPSTTVVLQKPDKHQILIESIFVGFIICAPVFVICTPSS